MSFELDPDNDFEAAIIAMVETHRSKAADYTDGAANQNFYDTAYQLSQSAGHACETLIPTKQARLRTLLPKFWAGGAKPNNESIYDTLLDRAVYSVIAMTIWNEGGYTPEEVA